jgi:hypothetical protein
MSGYFDELMLQQQEKAQQQQAAHEARLYNPDGSAKANDYRPPASLTASTIPNVEPRGGGELIVHRDRLLSVARTMQQDLAHLQATLAQLESAGAGGATIGGWETADAFGTNAGNAYTGIWQFYQALNTAYEMVITNLRQSVSNYEDAESATVGAIHGVSADTASTPASSWT